MKKLIILFLIVAGGLLVYYSINKQENNLMNENNQPSEKRAAPKEIEPLIYRGVKYTAPHFGALIGKDFNGGHVLAYDEKTGELLWDAVVYEPAQESGVESDSSDIFITELKIENDRLIVVNENRERFALDLKTGKLIK